MPSNKTVPYALIALFAPIVCSAQFNGYINGTQSLTSFSWSTGAVVNSFATGGTGNSFAVAFNDVTLYLATPFYDNSGRALNVVNGQSGQLLDSIPLGFSALKVIVTSQGGTAFVLGSYNQSVGYKIFAVDLATLKVTATLLMPLPDSVFDIALSPDNATLYVAVNCNGPACGDIQGACPLVHGTCAFDTSTLALKTSAENVVGYIAVSQDSKSLYLTSYSQEFYILDASTLAPVYKNPIRFPYNAYGAAIVSPVGHYAIVLTGLNPESSLTAYTLDTSTNTIVSEFFVDAPFGGILTGGTSVGAAFAPNGASVWMLVACDGIIPTCTVPGPTGRAIAGIAFPSGLSVGAASVPPDGIAIAFPRLAAQ